MAADKQEMAYRIRGSRDSATVVNFVLPHLDDRVVVEVDGTTTVEELGKRSSYTHQLEALTSAVRDGAALPLDTEDAVLSMRLIDQAYVAAGLLPRPRWAG